MANQVYQIAGLTDHLAAAIDAARAATTDKRWRNAIDAGASWLLEQDMITFDAERHELTVNSPSGATYQANGVCQCRAFEVEQACWHRAAARLVRRALEAQWEASGLIDRPGAPIGVACYGEPVFLPPSAPTVAERLAAARRVAAELYS